MLSEILFYFRALCIVEIHLAKKLLTIRLTNMPQTIKNNAFNEMFWHCLTLSL